MVVDAHPIACKQAPKLGYNFGVCNGVSVTGPNKPDGVSFQLLASVMGFSRRGTLP